jgi:hypothetical protein
LLILTSVAQALDPTSVFTIAAGFITSCPASSPALPFKPFPSLSVVTKSNERRDLSINVGSGHKKSWSPKAAPPPCAGEKVEFSAASAIPEGSYVTFVSGLSVVSVKGEIQGKLHSQYTVLSTIANASNR